LTIERAIALFVAMFDAVIVEEFATAGEGVS
jgi:hypothetical protein